jgi:hypothetical protein
MKLSKVTELITEFLPLMLKDWKEKLFPSKKSLRTKIRKITLTSSLEMRIHGIVLKKYLIIILDEVLCCK